MPRVEDPDTILQRRWSSLDGATTRQLPTVSLRPWAAESGPGSDDHDDFDGLPHVSVTDRSNGACVAEAADLERESTIGEGGMGRVHLVWQRSLSRHVAVKTVKGTARGASAAALVREARLTGALEHPGVVPVHALGVDDVGAPILVMKRVEGVDMRALLQDRAHPLWAARGGPSPDHLAVGIEILEKVCETLEFAHSREIVHRDIKAENIMVGRYGEVYLMDWGIATTFQTADAGASLVGTPTTMAPEMVAGGPVDQRTDVYLLGALLHQLLTSTPRHHGSDIKAALKLALLSSPVVYDASVPSRLADLCNRATALSPSDRPPTARAFRDELREFLRDRAAASLATATEDRLERLERLLAEAPASAPPDLAAAYQLGAEARFGFTQCLEMAPHLPVARAGLRRSMVSLAELELRQAHVETAAALIRGLDDPPPALVARLAEAEEKRARERRDAADAREMARGLDPSTSRGARGAVLGAFALASLAISCAVITGRLGTLTTGRLLALGVPPFLLSIGGYIVLRQRRANLFNRRLALLLTLTTGTMLASRAHAALFGASVHEALTRDIFLLLSLAFAGALAIEPRMLLTTVPILAGLAAMALAPSADVTIFAIALSVAVLVLACALLWPKRPTSAG